MTAATPAPCPCGAASDWEAERDGKYYISCSVPGCWIGPSAETKVEAIAAWNRVAGQGWQPINTARRDGTVVIVYAPAAYDLPEIVSLCAYHPDGGWCVDELRWVTHWRPLPAPPVSTKGSTDDSTA